MSGFGALNGWMIGLVTIWERNLLHERSAALCGTLEAQAGQIAELELEIREQATAADCFLREQTESLELQLEEQAATAEQRLQVEAEVSLSALRKQSITAAAELEQCRKTAAEVAAAAAKETAEVAVIHNQALDAIKLELLAQQQERTKAEGQADTAQTAIRQCRQSQQELFNQRSEIENQLDEAVQQTALHEARAEEAEMSVRGLQVIN